MKIFRASLMALLVVASFVVSSGMSAEARDWWGHDRGLHLGWRNHNPWNRGYYGYNGWTAQRTYDRDFDRYNRWRAYRNNRLYGSRYYRGWY